MDEQQLDQTVERVKAAGEVIATPDPAIRSQAFAVLIGQPTSGVSEHGGEFVSARSRRARTSRSWPLSS